MNINIISGTNIFAQRNASFSNFSESSLDETNLFDLSLCDAVVEQNEFSSIPTILQNITEQEPKSVSGDDETVALEDVSHVLDMTNIAFSAIANIISVDKNLMEAKIQMNNDINYEVDIATQELPKSNDIFYAPISTINKLENIHNYNYDLNILPTPFVNNSIEHDDAPIPNIATQNAPKSNDIFYAPISTINKLENIHNYNYDLNILPTPFVNNSIEHDDAPIPNIATQELPKYQDVTSSNVLNTANEVNLYNNLINNAVKPENKIVEQKVKNTASVPFGVQTNNVDDVAQVDGTDIYEYAFINPKIHVTKMTTEDGEDATINEHKFINISAKDSKIQESVHAENRIYENKFINTSTFDDKYVVKPVEVEEANNSETPDDVVVNFAKPSNISDINPEAVSNNISYELEPIDIIETVVNVDENLNNNASKKSAISSELETENAPIIQVVKENIHKDAFPNINRVANDKVDNIEPLSKKNEYEMHKIPVDIATENTKEPFVVEPHVAKIAASTKPEIHKAVGRQYIVDDQKNIAKPNNAVSTAIDNPEQIKVHADNNIIVTDNNIAEEIISPNANINVTAKSNSTENIVDSSDGADIYEDKFINITEQEANNEQHNNSGQNFSSSADNGAIVSNNNENATVIDNKTFQNHIDSHTAQKSTNSLQYKTFTNVKIQDYPQVVMKYSQSLLPGVGGTAHLVMNPESLGTVFVDINTSEEKTVITFKAESQESLVAIEKNIGTLKELFAKDNTSNIEYKFEKTNNGWKDDFSDQNQNKNNKHEEQNARRNFVNSIVNTVQDEPQALENEVKYRFRQGKIIEKYI